MKAAIASIVALSAMVANAGPFGYEMGQKIEGEPHLIKQNGWHSRVITSNLPAPFTMLILYYMPNAGLCQIAAYAASDDYGAHVFSKLEVRLTDKYGEPALKRTPREIAWHHVNVEDIGAILLFEEDRPKFYSAVSYQFTNYYDCKAEAKAMRQENPLLDSL